MRDVVSLCGRVQVEHMSAIKELIGQENRGIALSLGDVTRIFWQFASFKASNSEIARLSCVSGSPRNVYGSRRSHEGFSTHRSFRVLRPLQNASLTEAFLNKKTVLEYSVRGLPTMKPKRNYNDVHQ